MFSLHRVGLDLTIFTRADLRKSISSSKNQIMGCPIIIGWPYIGRPIIGWFMMLLDDVVDEDDEEDDGDCLVACCCGSGWLL